MAGVKLTWHVHTLTIYCLTSQTFDILDDNFSTVIILSRNVYLVSKLPSPLSCRRDRILPFLFNLATMAKPFKVDNVPHDTVFYIASEITINCPAAHAYKVLRDTSAWPNWNSFIPKADVTAPDGINDPSFLERGSKIVMHVRMSPKSPAMRAQKEEVVEVSEHSPLSISWCQATMPKMLLRTLRVNEFRAVDVNGEDGSQSCQYRTWITMAGPMAYAVKLTTAGTLQARFNDNAEDLKRYAEEIWKLQQTTTT